MIIERDKCTMDTDWTAHNAGLCVVCRLVVLSPVLCLCGWVAHLSQLIRSTGTISGKYKLRLLNHPASGTPLNTTFSITVYGLPDNTSAFYCDHQRLP